MGEKKNAYKIVVGKLKVNKSFELPRYRWDNNIKKCLKDI
jgi:hypothetical protein